MIYLIMAFVICYEWWVILKYQTEATHYKTLYNQVRLARYKNE